jgi:hypothetical protein
MLPIANQKEIKSIPEIYIGSYLRAQQANRGDSLPGIRLSSTAMGWCVRLKRIETAKQKPYLRN